MKPLRLHVFAILFFPMIVCGSVTALGFDKVDANLTYWYRAYFDILHFEELIDSLSGQKLVTHPDGSIDIALLPDWITGLSNVSESPIKLIDGVPHVILSLGYNGDGADLDAIGVVYSIFAKESAIVVIPLENLPKLDSIPTVNRISSGQVEVVQAENAVPVVQQSADTVSNSNSGTIIVQLPRIKSNHWLEFLLLGDNSDKSKQSKYWIYEYPTNESDDMEIILSVPMPATYQLIVKCVGDFSRILSYSGVEVIQDSVSMVSLPEEIGARGATVNVQFQEWDGSRRADNSLAEKNSIRKQLGLRKQSEH